jgi:hypothetical protein
LATFTDVATVAGTASSAVVKGVPPGTTYVRVTATYGDRPRAASAPVAVTMPQAPQPTSFRASSGAGYVQLQWDSIPDAVGYTLSRLEAGTPTPLDDHVPERTPARLSRRSFVDTRGPGGTVGYVLSAVYRAIDGAEYEGDPAAQPRTPATPLPVEAGTNDSVRVTGFIKGNAVYVQYRAVPGIGWVSAMAVDVLGPTGWTQLDRETFSWGNPTAKYRAVPGPRNGGIYLDQNIATGCDHTLVFRLRATVSVGGGPTAPQQVMGEDRSRPTSVTYDDGFSKCHRSQ